MRRAHYYLRAGLGALALAGALIVSAGPAAADPLTTWTAGPEAAGDSTFDGYIDGPANGATIAAGASFVVGGWFVDRAAEGWAGADDIQVWNGTMDGGGTMLARALFAQNRPDVAAALGNPYWAASGFSATLRGAQLRSGGNTLSVYAHTPGKGWWYKQVNVTISGTAPAAPAPAPGPAPAPAATVPQAVPGGPPVVVIIVPKASEKTDTRRDYEMRGYALDPAAQPTQGSQGSGIDRVQVYVDGERGQARSVLLGEATLAYSEAEASARYGPQFVNSGWRLTFKPTTLRADDHTLYVYARSVVTGRETLATVGLQIVEQ